MAYPALSMTSVCDRRRGSRQSASPDVPRSAGCTGCNGAHTATCNFVMVPHERGSLDGDEAAGWNRDGRGRTTVLAFCMTPPWDGPLTGSRMVNGSERKVYVQTIMAAWKRQADCRRPYETFPILLFDNRFPSCHCAYMPRKSRLVAPGALHHVIVRGIDRANRELGISTVELAKRLKIAQPTVTQSVACGE
jgi:hypothetical protein